MKPGHESAEGWGAKLKPPISARRARKLCEDGRVKGAEAIGIPPRITYQVPIGAKDPRKDPWRPRKKEKK